MGAGLLSCRVSVRRYFFLLRFGFRRCDDGLRGLPRQPLRLEPFAVVGKCLLRNLVFGHRFIGIDLAKCLTGFALGGGYLSLKCLVAHFLPF
jgi:hypothetical protein